MASFGVEGIRYFSNTRAAGVSIALVFRLFQVLFNPISLHRHKR